MLFIFMKLTYISQLFNQPFKYKFILPIKTKVYESRNKFLKMYFYFSIQDLGGYKRGIGEADWLNTIYNLLF